MISGKLKVYVNGENHYLEPGQELLVTKGQVHSISVANNETIHAMITIMPSLRFELFLETLHGLAKDGKTSSKGVMNPLQMMILLKEFQSEIRLPPGPPAMALKVLSIIGAPIARWLGYKAVYPQYSTS